MHRLVLIALLFSSLRAVAGGADPLSDVQILYPVSASTFWVNPDLGGIVLPVLSDTDSPADTDAVEVFLAQQGEGLPGQRIGIDVQHPYFLDIPVGTGVLFDQVLTLSARATSLSDPVFQPMSAIQFAYAAAEGDSDGNGLPDAPDDLFIAPGDAWFSTAAFGDDPIPRMYSVAAMLVPPADVDSFIEVPLVLPKLTSPGQEARVTATGEVLEAGETGLFIVQMADTLDHLVGEEEAENFAKAPSSILGDDDPVMTVVAARRTGPNAYSMLRADRLQEHPVSVVLDGLALNVARAYGVYQHPVQLEAGDAEGLEITIPRGRSWVALPDAEVEVDLGRVRVEVTQPGVLSLFAFEIDGGEGEGEGEGESDDNLLARILAALGILGLVDGGVGGGGPCFIASAAYGTPLAGEIDALRAFRDQALLSNSIGTAFVDTYYHVSPAIADQVARSPVLAMMFRVAIAVVLLAIDVAKALGGPGLLLGVGVVALIVVRNRRFSISVS